MLLWLEKGENRGTQMYFSALVDSLMTNMRLCSLNSAHPIHRRHQLGLYGILSCQKGSFRKTAGM